MPSPPPGNLPNPGNKPTSASPAMQMDSLPAEPPRKPTMEYYSATKNEIIPFAARWMDPEIVILSEVRSDEDKYQYDIVFTWNLK